jgi:hypothetical protein
MVIILAIVLAALSLYTVWSTRDTIAPPDRQRGGISRVH